MMRKESFEEVDPSLGRRKHQRRNQCSRFFPARICIGGGRGRGEGKETIKRKVMQEIVPK
jgi:hypothetical protein